MTALLASVPEVVLTHIARVADTALPTILISVKPDDNTCAIEVNNNNTNIIPAVPTTAVTISDICLVLQGTIPPTSRDNSIHHYTNNINNTTNNNNNNKKPGIISELFPHPVTHKHPWDRFSLFHEHLEALARRTAYIYPSISTANVMCDIATAALKLRELLRPIEMPHRGPMEVIVWGPSLFACYYRKVCVCADVAVDLFIMPSEAAVSDESELLTSAGCDAVTSRIVRCMSPVLDANCSVLSDGGSIVLLCPEGRLIMNSGDYLCDRETLSVLAATAKENNIETVEQIITISDILEAKAVSIVSVSYGGSVLIPVNKVLCMTTLLEKGDLPSSLSSLLNTCNDKKFLWMAKDSDVFVPIAKELCLTLELDSQPIILPRYDGSYVPPPEDDDEDDVYLDDEEYCVYSDSDNVQ